MSAPKPESHTNTIALLNFTLHVLLNIEHKNKIKSRNEKSHIKSTLTTYLKTNIIERQHTIIAKIGKDIKHLTHLSLMFAIQNKIEAMLLLNKIMLRS